MFTRAYTSPYVVLFLVIFLVPISFATADQTFQVGTIVQTASTFRWNNNNWFTTEHPRVAEFTVRTDGSAYGMTETGVAFFQENIQNELNVRIQKFVMEDHYHYVIDGDVVYSLEDFSIKLARAYEQKIAGA